MALSPGDRIDRYEILGLLGSGGMGEVYRARDTKLARLVALKILHADATPGSAGAARLLREARAAAALSHPNVLAVFDVGEVREPESLRGTAYIAMELVVGTSFRSYIGDESVPIERRVTWLRDVAQALAAAHRVGIVHRDVKPENVMVRSDGGVKVLDFGIARRVMTAIERQASTAGQSVPLKHEASGPAATQTEQGKAIGTPYYMAPEQLRAESIDGRTDQFAWGVLAYELLTGSGPWQRDADPVVTVSEILTRKPPSLLEVEQRVPKSVSETVARALAKDRSDRFPTMEALVAHLDGAPASAGERPVAASAAPREITQAFGARAPAGAARPLVRWLVGASAAVAVAGAAWTLLRTRSYATNRSPTTSPSGIDPSGDEACTSNAQCVASHDGGAWHCNSRRHACVELASQDCTVSAEPHAIEADDVVWFGGMFPPKSDLGLVSEMRAADLARQDFAQALGPSASRAGPLHARPIGLVLCDESVDPVRVAHHLAEVAEVPAVIGFRSSASALLTIPTVFLPNHVLSLISINQSPSLTKIPEPELEPRLIWRSTLNIDAAVVALAHLISDVLEPQARAEPNGIGPRPFKVAAVLPRNISHIFVESLFRILRFNGRSALENGSNFQQSVFETSEDAGINNAVQDLLVFAPDVVVLAGTKFVPEVIPMLEARWAGTHRPSYLSISGIRSSGYRAFAGRDASRRRRFLAITNFSTTMTNAQLVLRYNLAFPTEPVTRSEAPQPSYDAFYVLAYATYALADSPITGPALSRAMARLQPPGPLVNVGPQEILEAFSALRRNTDTTIDLNGAIGSLDFDPTTGEASIDYAVVCPDVDDQGIATTTTDSGLVYDSKVGKFRGSLHCP